MILFCLPYAGGSESIYYKWKKYLNSTIQLVPLELKGRGKRYCEDLYEDIDEAVEDIFQNIKNEIVYDNYAVFGHSMGSLLAYELYYKIEERNLKKPKHMFFSGYRAPSIIRKRENLYSLPNYDFMKKIMELGGTPEELLKNKELLEIYIPILRNDFKMLETYVYKERMNKIQCNISALNGKQDSIAEKDIVAWKNHTNGICKVYNYEGDHFFLNTNQENIINDINSILCDE